MFSGRGFDSRRLHQQRILGCSPHDVKYVVDGDAMVSTGKDRKIGSR